MTWKDVLGVTACIVFLSAIALFGFDYLGGIQELEENRN